MASDFSISTPEEFEKIYEEVKDKKLVATNVLLSGNERTKAVIIARELQPLQQARSLDEIKDALLEIHDSLMSLDVFDAVEIIISDSDLGRPDTCTVLINCSEKGRFRLNTGTYVTGTEGSLEFSLGLTNNLGRAEDVTITAELGSQNSTEFSVSIAKPRLQGTSVGSQFQVAQQSRCLQQYSSYTEDTRKTAVTLYSADGTHALTYELAWRHLHDPTRRASPQVRKQLGHNLKSSLQYVYRWVTLDDPYYPTEGYGLRSSTEVAGLGWDANLLRFARQQLQAQWCCALGSGVVFSVTGGLGVTVPWGEAWRTRSTCISDRFFLGGVSGDLRGFQFKGVGPCDFRRPRENDNEEEGERLVKDRVGGDLLLSLLAQLRFPLPVPAMQAAGMYGHVFVNTGNLVQLTSQGDASGSPHPLEQGLKAFGRSFRWSAGAGIVWPTTIGKLELNLCKVLKADRHDKLLSTGFGLQVGFSPAI
ncbi:g12227 [Coccomyxa viridis]|uniref:G12227 protein n=1 Tax=Coccomyxa viridis TaxID=1274662 RepID=A0ABP1G9U8_9CHLO